MKIIDDDTQISQGRPSSLFVFLLSGTQTLTLYPALSLIRSLLSDEEKSWHFNFEFLRDDLVNIKSLENPCRRRRRRRSCSDIYIRDAHRLTTHALALFIHTMFHVKYGTSNSPRDELKVLLN